MWKWIKAENCRYECANLCKKRAGKCPEETKEARMDGNEEKRMAVKKKSWMWKQSIKQGDRKNNIQEEKYCCVLE